MLPYSQKQQGDGNEETAVWQGKCRRTAFPGKKDLPEISGPGLYEKRSLVEKNLAIVTFVANKYTGRATEFEDLVSVGNIGLIKAADTFDPFKMYNFPPMLPSVVLKMKF